MKKILLVEDDMALAMATEFALEQEDYQVLHGSTISRARELLQEKPDLVLLDVTLPDGNGYELCKEIRKTNGTLPICFLTAMSDEINIVQGLEIGGDDYISKPYRVRELLSRIKVLLRRVEMMNNKSMNQDMGEEARIPNYFFGHHEFRQEEFKLLRDGATVECTTVELKLLREFLQHRGMALSRSQILERALDTESSYVDDNTLSVYIKRLRDKLGEDAEYIETVRGIGYRFR